MSAISVVWNHANGPPAKSLQTHMLSAQEKFGLRGCFFWSDRHISLGGNRSNFLPEDKFDLQPIWSPDGTACVVADLRLDNRADLARTLNLPHPEELADSSILMEAWLRWGSSCLDHIIGGFAFAVWTPARQELFAARDHAGERPLFYHRSDSLFALASMPAGLLALPGVSRELEDDRILDWLAFEMPNRHKSFFRKIACVPSGHFLRVTPAGFECKQYWHPSDAAPTRFKRDQDYVEALLEIFDHATEARLRSNHPVASHLSAGLDSSSVTATAARLLAAQGKGLTAFTAVPRPQFHNRSQPWNLVNEGPAASEVAALYPNIQHVLVDSSGYDLVANMKSWIDAMGEPALNVVNFMWLTATLDQSRQRGIEVVLQGGNGNTTISWESKQILPHLFRTGQWIKLFNTARSLRSHGDISIRSAARIALADVLPAWLRRRLIHANRLQNSYQPLANPEVMEKRAILQKVFEAQLESPGLAADHKRFFEQTDAGPFRAATQAIAGIEFRDPTADKRVFEFCYSIPPEQYVVGGHSRSLVRRAMKGRLPESTLSRYLRGEQGADWYLAMQESMPSLREEVTLAAHSPAARRTLDLSAMQDLLDRWPSSGYELNEVSLVWQHALTRAISLGYFLHSHQSASAAPSLAPASHSSAAE